MMRTLAVTASQALAQDPALSAVGAERLARVNRLHLRWEAGHRALASLVPLCVTETSLAAARRLSADLARLPSGGSCESAWPAEDEAWLAWEGRLAAAGRSSRGLRLSP